MQSIVCCKFIDNYMLINRENLKALRIPENLYLYLLLQQESGYQNSDEIIPTLLTKLGVTSDHTNLSELLFVRPLPKMTFGRATYEITEACNFKCRHCILGHRHRLNLGLKKRILLLDTLAEAGCLWLQITGGEAMMDKYFEETYRYAYAKGFLITLSTNGSQLSKPKIYRMLAELPPYRVAVSIYGATAKSFNALTMNSNGFESFLKGLQYAKEIRLRVRANIIKTIFNQDEITDMRSLAESFGFEHHTYSELLPTLDGDSNPFCIMANRSEKDIQTNAHVDKIPQGINWLERCGAGRKFFHVDCLGNASICQSARSLQINLLEEGLESLSKLHGFSKGLLETPSECPSCPSWRTCLNCPPKLALYEQSGGIPEYVCQTLSTKKKK